MAVPSFEETETAASVEILNSIFLPYETAEEWEFLASVDFLRKGLTLAQVTLASL